MVTGVTVIADLAIAVVVGVIVSALVFAWKHARHIEAKSHIDNDGWKVYELDGPLFFGSTTLFLSKFTVSDDPQEVIIDFSESRIMDQSAIEAINKIAERYQVESKTVHLRHLSRDCIKLIKRADKICDINVLEDPDYFVAIDNYHSEKEAKDLAFMKQELKA